MQEIPGSEFELDCDLVLLALGFLGPEKPGTLSDLELELELLRRRRHEPALGANRSHASPSRRRTGRHPPDHAE